MSKADPIHNALRHPHGARFYRCALQINPFEYLARHNKSTSFGSEDEYNRAIVKACKQLGIDVIAVTDHYRIQSATRLLTEARTADIHVFPGFEAKSKEGVHLLCLFDAERPILDLERFIGDCGIHGDGNASPTGDYDVLELLERVRTSWSGVCVAAHVASDGGLLTTLGGQSGIRAWRSSHLLTCSIPGPIADVPENLRPILENKNADYRREHPIAVINAQDVSSPDDLAKPGASCWIKMSKVSIEGLRQAFLDPRSRIRLSSDPEPEDHAEFLAMTWEGGFLDGTAIHFNENLNVLVGGRGTGKSTVVESLRYVLGLDPLGEEARKAHDGIIRQVLKSGTKVSLLIESHRPAKRKYRIERTIPNAPVVRDETGKVLKLTPTDVLPLAEVYGQHEISELSKDREKLTHLLERFVERDESLARRKADLRRELDRSRSRILDVSKELKQIEEHLAALPGLEETLGRFQEAGLEERLKERSLLVREERVLKTAAERVGPFRDLLEQLRGELPIDRAFLSSKALKGLPGKQILMDADAVLEKLSQEIETLSTGIGKALLRADQGLSAVRDKWKARKDEVQQAYEKILRELQKSKVDGEEFIRLRRQIEELRPLREREALLRRTEKEHEDQRRSLLAEWEDLKAEEFRYLERAARKVSKKLAARVRVQVTFAGNREPLFQLLRDQIGGQLAKTIETLEALPDLSLGSFSEACRAGVDELRQKFKLTPVQAKNIAEAPAGVFMQIEELDLTSTTKIELNVAAAEDPPDWHALEDLSTGQKATAVLLLLLLESEAPLVVDQPEDDLDNRFITEGVVPKMREEKRRRQFVFATHNANIPVLGDAELILGLTAAGEAGEGKARIPREHMGSIDEQAVRELVEEVLEGGKDAFEMRRLKYGF
jgi:energy-coupling factor transporter ATP-binding protein EcfA2